MHYVERLTKKLTSDILLIHVLKEPLGQAFFSASGPKLNENKTQNSMKIFQKLKEIMAKTQFSGKSKI